MTDFFERQNLAKRKTQILLLYFVPAVALTIGALYLFLTVLVNDKHFDYQLALWVTEGSLVIIIGGSFFKIWNLQQGGSSIATMLGGRLLPLQPVDADEIKFRNVVEEMSIASGVPVPQLFVLPGESGINAFAAGYTTNDAAIVVTKGALRQLSRDELQGVIAHEFSHILNGDMSLNLWVIGVVHGILCIALLGKLIIRLAWQDVDRTTIPFTLIGSVIFGIGIIGYCFGTLIKCAVSRQREYLADAAAVQFTRNPLGLAGALKKIGGSRDGSDVIAANAAEVSHLFFADAHTSWLSTHPPISARIKLLDPTFDGNFPIVKTLADESPAVTRGIQYILQRPTETRAVENTISRRRPGPQHLEYAAELKASFPPEIAAAAREPFGACALVYAVLLDCDPEARSKQLVEATEVGERPTLDAALQYFSTINTLGAGQKLALLNVAVPALRQLSPNQFQTFSKTVQLLVESDSEISLFEYSLQKTLLRHVEPHFKTVKPAIAQYYAAAGLAPECAILLSALAYESSDSNPEIAAAFQVGAEDLEFPRNKQISLLPPDECNLLQIDAAIQKITQASLPVKRQILNACALVVASDSLVNEDEAEMLRAIADAIGCPLPPFVSSIGIAEPAQ